MLRVILLTHTSEPEKVVARAGRLCYFKGGIEELEGVVSSSAVSTLVEKLAESGHYSAFEHAGFTFAIEGISRACSHQLVRHRIASYSQQSQRYVAMADNFCHIIPPSVAKNKKALSIFSKSVKEAKKYYDRLVEAGVDKEDARYLLPNASETKIIVTMNARELLHFFTLRLCRRAQWEIRDMAKLMLKECRKAARLIFKNAGPECVRTRCPEGRLSCGKPKEVKKEIGDL